MCGIVGVVGAAPSGVRIDEFLPRLERRGPDGSWSERHQGVQIGATRLAIVDGDRDLGTESIGSAGSVVVLLNGEIWNRAAVARRLGLSADASEQAVIRASHRAWGASFAHALEGIFAIAVIDKDRGELVLARDPLGVKPLYVYSDPERVSFASDPVVAAQVGGCTAAANPDFLRNSLVFGFTDWQSCVIRDVHLLPPGDTWVASFTRDGVRDGITKIPAALSEGRRDLSILSTVLEQQFRHDDTEVCALLLSGGVDSSLLAVLASEIGADSIRCVVFGDEQEDLEPAREVARLVGLELIEVPIDPTALRSGWKRACRTMSGTSALSAYHLFERLRSVEPEIKVVYCGEGADELFGGYPWNLDPSRRISRLAARLNAVDRDTWSPLMVDVGASIEQMGDDQDATEALAWSLAFDRGPQLDGNHTVPFDASGMAFSFEVRVPFLDRRVLECATTYAPTELVHECRTKAPLRDYLRELHPDVEALTRTPKRGFPSSFRSGMRALRREAAPQTEGRLHGIPRSFARSGFHLAWLEEVQGFIDDEVSTAIT